MRLCSWYNIVVTMNEAMWNDAVCMYVNLSCGGLSTSLLYSLPFPERQYCESLSVTDSRFNRPNPSLTPQSPSKTNTMPPHLRTIHTTKNPGYQNNPPSQETIACAAKHSIKKT